MRPLMGLVREKSPNATSILSWLLPFSIIALADASKVRFLKARRERHGAGERCMANRAHHAAHARHACTRSSGFRATARRHAGAVAPCLGGGAASELLGADPLAFPLSPPFFPLLSPPLPRNLARRRHPLPFLSSPSLFPPPLFPPSASLPLRQRPHPLVSPPAPAGPRRRIRRPAAARRDRACRRGVGASARPASSPTRKRPNPARAPLLSTPCAHRCSRRTRPHSWYFLEAPLRLGLPCQRSRPGSRGQLPTVLSRLAARSVRR